MNCSTPDWRPLFLPIVMLSAQSALDCPSDKELPTSPKPAEASKLHPNAVDVSKWKKVGPQLGSNPGGTYEDENGKKWYVKESKSDDHAKNEVLAGKLYELAGSPVVDYKLAQFPCLRGALIRSVERQSRRMMPGAGAIEGLTSSRVMDTLCPNSPEFQRHH